MSSKSSRVLKISDGRHVLLSADAFAMLEARGQSVPLDEIAGLVSDRRGAQVSQEEVAAALQTLDEKLERISTTKPEEGFFLFRLPLIPAKVVDFIATRLTWLYAGPIASTIGVLGVALTVLSLLYGRLPGQIGGQDWAWAYGLFFLTVIFHEFGHATACRAFGVRPSSIGVTAFFVLPAFYSDVSGSWPLGRWQRLVVDLGGVYFQCLALVPIALFAIFSKSIVAYYAELIILTGMVFNLNPVLRLDGYWALADVLDIPNLAAEPMKIVRNMTSGDRTRFRKWSPTQLIAILAFGIVNTSAWIYFLSLSIIGLLRSPSRLMHAVTEIARGAFSVSDLLLFLFTFMSLAVVVFGLARLGKALLGGLTHSAADFKVAQ